MFPTASVSGYYFGSPHAKYFGLGKIAEDQLKDYAKEKEFLCRKRKMVVT
jgi:5-methyltetrahydrofolate--homocysteine methyltransferase